jgi:hypothetical protein
MPDIFTSPLKLLRNLYLQKQVTTPWNGNKTELLKLSPSPWRYEPNGGAGSIPRVGSVPSRILPQRLSSFGQAPRHELFCLALERQSYDTV